MSNSPRTVRQWLRRLPFLICSSFFLLACIIWDLAGYQVDQDVYAWTHTAWADEQTEWAWRSTEDHEWDLLRQTDVAGTEAARRLIEQGTIQPHKPPVIDWVYFPSVIAGDGTTYHGELQFQDQMGDVNRITIQVFSAVNFGGADYDPRPYLIRGDQYNGVYQLYIWCQGEQTVKLVITLYDSMGSRSNSAPLEFKCI